MSDLSDPAVQAYLMAYAAVEAFGFTREDKNAYAARLSQVGLERGLQAEAEAIAEDCKSRGLEMSAGRVMKALVHFQERHARRVTYIPEQNTLIVADGYAPGEDPMEVMRNFGRPSPRGYETAASPRTKSSGGGWLGFIAGLIVMMVAFNKYQVGDGTAVALGVGVWVAVAMAWNRLRR